MRRVLFLTVLAGLVCFLPACQQDRPASTAAPAPAPVTTPAPAPAPASSSDVSLGPGIRLVNHTNKGGRKPQVGESVVMHLSTWIGDTLMISSRKKLGMPLTITIPVIDRKGAAVSGSAVFDAILLMGVGDSVSLYQPVSDLERKRLPARLQKETIARTDIVLVDIKAKNEQPTLNRPAH